MNIACLMTSPPYALATSLVALSFRAHSTIETFTGDLDASDIDTFRFALDPSWTFKTAIGATADFIQARLIAGVIVSELTEIISGSTVLTPELRSKLREVIICGHYLKGNGPLPLPALPCRSSVPSLAPGAEFPDLVGVHDITGRANKRSHAGGAEENRELVRPQQKTQTITTRQFAKFEEVLALLLQINASAMEVVMMADGIMKTQESCIRALQQHQRQVAIATAFISGDTDAATALLPECREWVAAASTTAIPDGSFPQDRTYIEHLRKQLLHSDS